MEVARDCGGYELRDLNQGKWENDTPKESILLKNPVIGQIAFVSRCYIAEDFRFFRKKGGFSAESRVKR